MATYPSATPPSLSRITHHRVLTAGEERELATRARAGDRKAANLLVEYNVRLVAKLAQQHRSPAIDFEDLLHEGIVGLIRAVETFDPDRETRFATYAVWWIRQAIQRGRARLARTVRLPMHADAQARALARIMNGPTVRNETLAHKALTAEQIEAVKRADAGAVSLSTPIGEDDATLEDFLEDPQSIDQVVDHLVLRDEVRRMLDYLSPRSRRVICLRFGLDGCVDHTLEDVAASLGMTPERTRQIEVRALRRLHTRAKARGLTEFLDTPGRDVP